MSAGAVELISGWLARCLSQEQSRWLATQVEKLSATPTDRDVQIALGMVPRKLGRSDLDLGGDDLADADRVRPGWRPSGWSVDMAARVLLLITAAPRMNDFPQRYAGFCRYGDVAEQISCYVALPLLPDPQSLEPQVGEGLRTNMRAVFQAIAHDNPYPAEQFDEHRWNHMVLKALFIGARLGPIVGLDRRANSELARILCDYAHERWAAGRKVTPELWRCVGPFAADAMIDDLKRALDDDDVLGRSGAALALSAAPDPRGRQVLSAHPDLADAIASGGVDWSIISARLLASDAAERAPARAEERSPS